jgi:hypothetical protein
MNQERRPETGGAPQDPKSGKTGVRRFLLPSRSSLHPWPRLAVAAALNIALAIWMVPQIGHATDPQYSINNAVWAALMLAAPCAALLSTVPVLLFGRDVPRLISIGLSFLPCYVAIAGFCDAFSLWSSSR